jgi:hypothetical protein
MRRPRRSPLSGSQRGPAAQIAAVLALGRAQRQRRRQRWAHPARACRTMSTSCGWVPTANVSRPRQRSSCQPEERVASLLHCLGAGGVLPDGNIESLVSSHARCVPLSWPCILQGTSAWEVSQQTPFSMPMMDLRGCVRVSRSVWRPRAARRFPLLYTARQTSEYRRPYVEISSISNASLLPLVHRPAKEAAASGVQCDTRRFKLKSSTCARSGAHFCLRFSGTARGMLKQCAGTRFWL